MKGKSFAAGLLVGLIIATSVTAFAAGQVVNAWLCDKEEAIIQVDGTPLDLPSDMHILMYDGRYYVPTRIIAESLGASVTWLENRKAIDIRSAEPIREIIEIEKIVEKEAPQTFSKVPVRQEINNVTMNIIGITRSENRTYLKFDVENEYGLPIYLDHEEAYIMIDGTKYKTIYNENLMWGWGNTLGPTEARREDQIVFEGVPRDVYDMKVVIPVKYTQVNYSNESKTYMFEFNVTFEN